jgi:ABC-type polysaccharide/polyol phosphate transport system ATPase subunit
VSAVAAAIIEVHGLQKSFSIPSVQRDTVRDHLLGLFRPRRFQTLRVLDDVGLEVASGETLGIMGRNGCGKSTLLKILCGIYRPDAGTVQVRGAVTPILELGLGWNPELNAVDNVLLIGTVMGLTLRQARASIDSVLAFAELERFANLQLKHYSSGMASRLAYAIAFEAVREILILDEVFAVGDAGFRLRCEERYRELHARGHTVVLVSHDPRTVSNFCDRAVLLEDGRVAASGPGPQVAEAYLARLAAAQRDPAARTA